MEKLDKSVRLAAASLREVGNIRQSLIWVSKYPKGFRERVDTFNSATSNISNFVISGGFKAKEMPNVSKIRRVYRKDYKEIITLSDLFTSYDDFIKEDPADSYIAESKASLADIKHQLVSGEWKFHPDVFSSPNTLLARILVEGYALDLEKYYQQRGLADTVKKALTEVLIKKYPHSALTEDVSWWSRLEREPSNCLTASGYLDLANQRNKDPLSLAVDNLNKHFREGRPAYEVLEDIRRFPRPIAVDFNNVIANNRLPLRLNPESPASLAELRKLGNVFIVTSAESWRGLQGFMVEHGIWSSDIVLMPSPSYEFISQWQEYDLNGKKLRQEYAQLSCEQGWNCTDEDLCLPPGYKCVAPLFNKSWKIPFIDNAPEPTLCNPGVFGIQVKEWISEEELRKDDWYARHVTRINKNKPTLLEAVDQVRQYLASLKT